MVAAAFCGGLHPSSCSCYLTGSFDSLVFTWKWGSCPLAAAPCHPTVAYCQVPFLVLVNNDDQVLVLYLLSKAIMYLGSCMLSPMIGCLCSMLVFVSPPPSRLFLGDDLCCFCLVLLHLELPLGVLAAAAASRLRASVAFCFVSPPHTLVLRVTVGLVRHTRQCHCAYSWVISAIIPLLLGFFQLHPAILFGQGYCTLILPVFLVDCS